MRLTLKPYQRIRKDSDFEHIRTAAKRYTTSAFTLYGLGRATPDTHSSCRRLGVVASRKVGPSVKRNYGKRCIREIFRHHQHELIAACDLVVILRSSFDQYTYTQLETFFLKATSHLRLLQHN